MRAIQPFAELTDTTIGLDVLRKIELVGRTCYKSTDVITEESAPKFVSNLIKRGHEAMLEHASFCFEVDYGAFRLVQGLIEQLSASCEYTPFIRFSADERFLMSGNVRAWRDLFAAMKLNCGIPNIFEPFIKENPILFPEFQDAIFVDCLCGEIRPVYTGDLKMSIEILTHCDVTVRFVVDRGISHELVRHRPASFAQESTRYCNYSKDKFGGQITFIIPEFFKYGSPEWHLWKGQMETVERIYLEMIRMGVTPEQARTILPNSLKTEVIMTANCAEWIHFFELRACNVTGKAHPQMLEVTRPLLDDFKKVFNGVFDHLTY